MKFPQAFICILLLCVPTRAAAQETMETYTPRVIFDLPWGKDPMEFGCWKDGPEDGEGMRWGPSSFAIDDDKAYVADFYQSPPHIKVFDMRGNLLRKIPVDRLTDGMVRVDDRGHLWLHNEIKHAIMEYDEEYNVIRKIIYDRKSGPINHNFELRDNKVYVGGQLINVRAQTDSLGKAGEKIVTGNKIPITADFDPRYIGKYTGNLYITNRGTVTIRKSIDEDIREDTIEKPDPEVDLVIFLSDDKSADSYFQVVKHPGDQSVREDYVYKYNAKNVLLSTIKIDSKHYTPIRNRIVIDKTGNIFQLITGTNGVTLVRWSH